MKHLLLPILLSTMLSGNSFAQTTVPVLPSLVKGTVWQEQKPEDGIRQSGEPTVPGILVKLLDSQTGNVVATAISSANGSYELPAIAGNYVIEYVFPTDGFTVATKRAGTDDQLNSAANSNRFSDAFVLANGATTDVFGLGLLANVNTITNCTSKPSTVTIWDENLLVSQSSVAPIPVSVKLYMNESVWHPTIGIENLGSAEAYDIVASGQVNMTLPNGQLLNTSTNIPKLGNLPAFDGDKDFGGTSGISWFNEFAYASTTYDYPAFLIAGTFLGNGQVSFPTESKSYVGITGSGNQQTLVQTSVSAGVCVVYTYEDGALPVKLISFKVNKEGAAANLTWKTTEEINSERFDIERSSNGKQWQTIGSVAAQGESAAVISYNFTDSEPMTGVNLYRLKMIDRDQTYAYSRINQLDFSGNTKFYVYPNPVADQLFLQTSSEDISRIQVFNISGKLVKDVNWVKQPVDVRSLATGTYAVRIVHASGLAENRNIVIVH
ncbi:MAG: choice-of-anchor E domain-containing protein [Dyadobacter sp.]